MQYLLDRQLVAQIRTLVLPLLHRDIGAATCLDTQWLTLCSGTSILWTSQAHLKFFPVTAKTITVMRYSVCHKTCRQSTSFSVFFFFAKILWHLPTHYYSGRYDGEKTVNTNSAIALTCAWGWQRETKLQAPWSWFGYFITRRLFPAKRLLRDHSDGRLDKTQHRFCHCSSPIYTGCTSLISNPTKY